MKLRGDATSFKFCAVLVAEKKFPSKIINIHWLQIEGGVDRLLLVVTLKEGKYIKIKLGQLLLLML